ncbi:MAG: hypothetical protein WC840_03800 [Candidatus Peribacteraceae bacterium]
MAVSVFGLGVFTFREIIRQETNFKRNQECAKYLPDIKRDFEQDSYWSKEVWAQTIVLKMFYSNSRKSCLYEWLQTTVSKENTIFFYTLTDALSNEILVRTEPLMPNQSSFWTKKQEFFDSVQKFD